MGTFETCSRRCSVFCMWSWCSQNEPIVIKTFSKQTNVIKMFPPTIWWKHFQNVVIVMTFGNVFWNGLIFFKLFILFSFGIDHDPPCFPCLHDLCLFPFLLCSSPHTITWPREVIIVLWSFRLQSIILWTHLHPYFLLLPPPPHHPYTPHLCQSTTALLEEGHPQDKRNDLEEGPASI